MLLCRARRSRSDHSHSMKADLAAWRALRLVRMMLLLRVGVRVDSLSLTMAGRMGFWPNASWYRLNPCTFCREFLTFKHQAKATSKTQYVSSRTLSNMSERARPWCSTRPLGQGASAQWFEQLC